MLAGLAAHSIQPLQNPTTGGYGLMLGVSGHLYGWPVVRGGSQKIADALVGHLQSLGGSVVTGRRISSMADFPPARAYLFDGTPPHLGAIPAASLPAGYRGQL